MRKLWIGRGKRDALWRGVGVGAGIGAGLMFFLDPDRGERRRAVARDKAVHLARSTGRTLEGRSRDLKNRARGIVAQIRSLLRAGTGVEEEPEQRVHTKRQQKSSPRRNTPIEPSTSEAKTSRSEETIQRPS